MSKVIESDKRRELLGFRYDLVEQDNLLEQCNVGISDQGVIINDYYNTFKKDVELFLDDFVGYKLGTKIKVVINRANLELIIQFSSVVVVPSSLIKFLCYGNGKMRISMNVGDITFSSTTGDLVFDIVTKLLIDYRCKGNFYQILFRRFELLRESYKSLEKLNFESTHITVQRNDLEKKIQKLEFDLMLVAGNVIITGNDSGVHLLINEVSKRSIIFTKRSGFLLDTTGLIITSLGDDRYSINRSGLFKRYIRVTDSWEILSKADYVAEVI